MDSISAIKSIENTTKATTRLPKPLRIKFYREMETSFYNENNINLLVLDRWLKTKIQETLNLVASVIENKIRRKQTKILTTRQHTFATSSLSNGGNTQNIVKCWLCWEDHKISDYDTLKNAPVELRIDIVKLNKLCFNCLSNSHFIYSCKSSNTCKIANCGKRYHTPLHKTETVDPPPEESCSDHSNIVEGTSNDHGVMFSKDFTYLQIIPAILKKWKC